MDGNGRWAKKRGLSRSIGHKQGAKTFEKIADHAKSIGIKTLTVYAFSTENWKRPADEVNSILNLMNSYMDEILKKDNEGIKIKFVGSQKGLTPQILEKMERTQKATENSEKITVNIAFNYGGREEILNAVKNIANDVKTGALQSEQIDEDLFGKYLYTAHSPDPELIIRPSGENRLSNFLLWQCAYSEFITTNKLWPDFTPEDFDSAIAEFAVRNRRFGGV